MNINQTNNYVNFGQKVPTGSLLKIGSGVFSYSEVKGFCDIFEHKFPGYLGYYGKAQIYFKNIEKNNPQIAKIVDELSQIESKDKKLQAISGYVEKLGDEIDVVI